MIDKPRAEKVERTREFKSFSQMIGEFGEFNLRTSG